MVAETIMKQQYARCRELEKQLNGGEESLTQMGLEEGCSEVMIREFKQREEMLERELEEKSK